MNGDKQVWRVRPAGRIVGVALTLFWAGIAVSASGNSAADILWLVDAALAIGIWRWAFVPYLAVDRRQVVVQNGFSKTTLDWSQIYDVHGGCFGLTLLLTDGESVTAWAAQKSNLASLIGQVVT